MSARSSFGDSVEAEFGGIALNSRIKALDTLGDSKSSNFSYRSQVTEWSYNMSLKLTLVFDTLRIIFKFDDF